MCIYLIIHDMLIIVSCLLVIRVDEQMELHIVMLTSILQVYSRLGLDLHFRTFFYFKCIYQESLVNNYSSYFLLLLLCLYECAKYQLSLPKLECCGSYILSIIMRNSQKVDEISRAQNLYWGRYSLSDPMPFLLSFIDFLKTMWRHQTQSVLYPPKTNHLSLSRKWNECPIR